MRNVEDGSIIMRWVEVGVVPVPGSSALEEHVGEAQPQGRVAVAFDHPLNILKAKTGTTFEIGRE